MKRENWVCLIILVGLLALGYFSSLYESDKINECSKDWVGIIIDKHSRKNRGYFIIYKYYVDDTAFTDSEPIGTEKGIKHFHVGDTIDIVINCSDPSVSRHIDL